MRCQVLISGGGIAGLTLALKLVKRNIHVIVVEKDVPPSPKYKGELLQPKSLEILANLGLIDQVYANGHVIHTTSIQELNETSNSGMKITFDYRILTHPYNHAVMIPHEVLKQLLLNRAKQYQHFEYICPAKLIAVHQLGKRYKASIQPKDAEDEIAIEADFYVGAEGRQSVIRKSLNIGLKESSYNHYFLTVSFPRPESLTEAQMVVKKHRFLGLFPLPNQRVRSVLLIRPEEYKQFRKQSIDYLYRAYTQLYPPLEGYVQEIVAWKDVQLMIPLRHNARQYTQKCFALIGDAAHSVHPMAGEGMNLAIQDSDVLGELLGWMYESQHLDSIYLKWYERVRRPLVEQVSMLSHQSALAYSYSFKLWKEIRMKTLYRISQNERLHFKQILNISGLGMWKESLVDRFIQAGLLPLTYNSHIHNSETYFYQKKDEYPWYYQKQI